MYLQFELSREHPAYSLLSISVSMALATGIGGLCLDLACGYQAKESRSKCNLDLQIPAHCNAIHRPIVHSALLVSVTGKLLVVLCIYPVPCLHGLAGSAISDSTQSMIAE